MKLEVGKSYKNRTGNKVQVLFIGLSGDMPVLAVVYDDYGGENDVSEATYTLNGKFRISEPGQGDIISEWVEPSEERCFYRTTDGYVYHLTKSELKEKERYIGSALIKINLKEIL